MKTLRSYGFSLAFLGLAVALTFFSQAFVRPVVCTGFCDAPPGTACPDSTCRAGEQRAGLPLPYRIDDPGGSSPTGGWGILGEEDLPNLLIFGLDVLFYACLIWLIGYLFDAWRRRKSGQKPDLLAVVMPLALVLAEALGGYLLYQPLGPSLP